MLKRKLNQISNWLSKNEKLIFFLVVVVFALEFFCAKYFVTGDGTAHLYNANIISHFILGTEGNLADYYELNTFPVPNWSGHFILAILNLFLPVYLVEKVFLTILFVSFVYSFRFFLKSFDTTSGFFSLVAIPFALSVFIYLGFYNFMLAFLFMFIAVGFYIRNHNQMNTLRTIYLMLFLILIYFSHLSILVFTIGFLFAYLGWAKLISKDKLKNKLFQFFRQAIPILIAALPTVILVYFYQIHHGTSEHFSYLSTDQLYQMILDLSPLVGHGPAEHFYTHIYLIILGLIFVFILFSRIFLEKTNAKILLINLKEADVLWLLAAVLLIGYFYIPDGDAKGGFVSIRILFLFYLVIVARLFLYRFAKSIKVLSVMSILFLFFFQLQIRRQGQQAMSLWAHEIVEASKKIEPYSVVLPVYCNSHWQGVNLVSYLGAKKPMVLLMNYEANQVFFPIKWKQEQPIHHTNSTHPNVFCEDYFVKFSTMNTLPDYIFFYGYHEINLPENCAEQNNFVRLKEYKVILSNDFCNLYELLK